MHGPSQRAPRRLVLIKHALPVLEPSRPAREWRLGDAGRARAAALAGPLERFRPLRLVTSAEPKAEETARCAAQALGVPHEIVADLHELDRPVLPILSRAEHRRLNAPLFSEPERAVLGAESAQAALARFSRALRVELLRTTDRSLVVVTHGTVIALFVAAQGGPPAFELWQRLACPSLLVLDPVSLALLEPIELADLGGRPRVPARNGP